jgi:rhodanese-related sulfurtransferase
MKYGWMALTFFFLTACGGKQSESTEKVLLSPQEFQNQFKPGVIIIDVRTEEEFTQGSLPNSLNIDFKNPEFIKNISILDKDKIYLLYCASGARSGRALELMRQEGFKNVYALEGGLNAWQAAGMPMN